MRLNLYSQSVVTLLSLLSCCLSELTSPVHSVRLDDEAAAAAAGFAFDAGAAATDANYGNCFVQSTAETDSQLQSQLQSDSEFLGFLAKTLLPKAVSGITKIFSGSRRKKSRRRKTKVVRGKGGAKGKSGARGKGGGSNSSSSTRAESNGFKKGMMISKLLND